MWGSTSKLKSDDAVLLAILTSVVITHQKTSNQIAVIDVHTAKQQQPKAPLLLKLVSRDDIYVSMGSQKGVVQFCLGVSFLGRVTGKTDPSGFPTLLKTIVGVIRPH